VFHKHRSQGDMICCCLVTLSIADLLSYAAFAITNQYNLLPFADIKLQWSKQKQTDALALHCAHHKPTRDGKANSVACCSMANTYEVGRSLFYIPVICVHTSRLAALCCCKCAAVQVLSARTPQPEVASSDTVQQHSHANRY